MSSRLSLQNEGRGFGNGSDAAAIQRLSFEGDSGAALGKQIEAMAYELRDVHDLNAGLPLSVIALPLHTRSKGLERAHKVFKGVGANLVLEREVSDWAEDTARLLSL